jgi:hypothetical protein
MPKQSNSWKWYCVKTVFRTEVFGRAKKKDRSYKAGLSGVEERLVLFRARNSDEALDKAAKEAREYALGSGRNRINVYGQTIKTRRLECQEAFELFDLPGNGEEIWSSTEITPKKVSDSQIILAKFGKPRSPCADWNSTSRSGLLTLIDRSVGSGMQEQIAYHTRGKRLK